MKYDDKEYMQKFLKEALIAKLSGIVKYRRKRDDEIWCKEKGYYRNRRIAIKFINGLENVAVRRYKSYYGKEEIHTEKFYSNGEIKEKISYRHRDRYTGNLSTRLLDREVCKKGKNGEEIRYYYTYNYDGNLEGTRKYVNGRLHGDSIFYFDDGTIKSVSSFVNGEQNGLKITYDQDGKIEYIINYKNGIPGKRIQGYENEQSVY